MNSLHLGAWTDVVWVTTGFLGDLILNTAAFEVLFKHKPHVRQHVITTPLGMKALAGVRSITSLIPFEKRGRNPVRSLSQTKSKLFTQLGSGHSHSFQPSEGRVVVLQVHRSFRSSLLTRWLGLPTITYVESVGAGHAIAKVPRVAPWHEASRMALLLEPLGIPRYELMAVRPRLEALSLSQNIDWQNTLMAWKERNISIIGIAPGSVWGTKRWLKDGFVDLVIQILQKTNHNVVLLGSDGEKKLCQEIMISVGTHNQRVMDLAGRTSLDDLRRVFPVLSGLVSNDSSPLHYGSAFNIPTVGLFGATVPEMGFGPLASRSVALGISLDCRPCSDHGPQVCPKVHFRCMSELSPVVVFQALQRLLTGEHS